MQSREGQFDSSVTRPELATSRRYLTCVLLVTSHSSSVDDKIVINAEHYYKNAWDVLYTIQRRTIRLASDPALTCHLQPLSHRRAVGVPSLFYQY
nr:unnamed protein product [Callosobruchus chinensis]